MACEMNLVSRKRLKAHGWEQSFAITSLLHRPFRQNVAEEGAAVIELERINKKPR